MHKKIAITIGSLLVVAAVVGGAGYWFIHLNQPDVTHTSSSGGSIALDSRQASQSSGSSAVPLSLDAASSSGASAPSPASSTSLQVNNSASSSSSGTSSASTGADFKGYEQYKTAQAALYGDIATGNGAEAAVGKKLTVNYRGWLTTGQLFDDSYAKGSSFSFTPGQHKVVLGWEEGVLGMKVGGKRRLIVPPAVGYGNQVYGPIPANSVLVFDVELLAVE